MSSTNGSECSEDSSRDRGGLVVGGLPVPPLLVELIRSGQWVPPGTEVLRGVFRDDPVQPCFYGEDMLVRENRSWHEETDLLWLGDPEDGGNLGIVPERSLSIADLGPDMPVMLDYRGSLSVPRVLYMRDEAWEQIAASVEELVDLLYPHEDG